MHANVYVEHPWTSPTAEAPIWKVKAVTVVLLNKGTHGDCWLSSVEFAAPRRCYLPESHKLNSSMCSIVVCVHCKVH